MTDVTLRVHEDGADDERIEQLTGFLRAELQELAPVSGVPGTPVEGAKSIELAAIGTLLVTLSQSTVLAALITAVSTWLGQRRERSVTLDADGDTLEMTGSPSPAERAAAAEWLARRRSRRYALIIASYEFTDPGLSSLRAPAHDAARLAEVLSDTRIGGFDVHTLINTSAAEVNEAVEDFFADREPDDLLVLHFSGHGVKDEAGELHLATSGTKLNRLAGTAVSADFIARRMNRSRSRRIVLLLDCCYSGAFGRGMVARAGGSLDLEEQFGGSGRAVITASSAVEYAFEGAVVADSSEGEPSVFTSALVEGLASGDADQDLDGFVGLDELYEYVYDRVRRVTPHQTPGKWMLDVRGDLRIARRARPVAVPAALPAELQEAIDHSLPGVRAGAVPELRRMLSVRHQGRALAARLALRHLAEDDSRMVAAAARAALGEEGEWTDLGRPAVPAPTSMIAARETTVADTGSTGRVTSKKPSRAAGSPTAAAGSPTAAAGSPSAAAGSPDAAAGSPDAAAGSPTATAGTPSATAAGSGSQVSGASSVAGAAAPAPGISTPATAPGHADAGVPPDREPPTSTLLRDSDTPASPHTQPSASSRHLTFTGSGNATSTPPAAIPPSARTPLPTPWRLGTQAVSFLALTAVVFGTVTVNDGFLRPVLNNATPATTFLTWALPWLLAAALLATAGTDHPWAPGAALGLTAGTAGLLAGTSDRYWLLLLGLGLTVIAFTRPNWTAIAATVVGAGALVVLVIEAEAILGQNDDPTWPVLFGFAVVLLIGLAAYELRAHWLDAVPPALLLLNATWAVLAEDFYPHDLMFLPLLVVVPLAEVLTTNTAKLAARLAIAAVLLARATEYAYTSSPDFALVSHVLLTLAAAATAVYVSRSR